MNLERVFEFRDFVLKKYFNREFYKYQREPSNAIITAALTGDAEEFNVEISRQAGKTEMIVLTLIFLILFLKSYLKKFGKYVPETYNIVLGAPQQEQAKTDFDRLKEYLEKVQDLFGLSFEEANRVTLKISNGITIYCFPVTINAKIESKTAHLIIGEEMQDIPDAIWDRRVVPMGAATNASKVLIGTAGYQLCYFYKGIESGRNTFMYDCWTVIKHRRAQYELDGEEHHLSYEKYIKAQILRKGESNPEIQTQFFLMWKLEKGMWMTEAQFDRAVDPKLPTIRVDQEHEVAVVVDVAKVSDVTFSTSLRKEGEKLVTRRIPDSEAEHGWREEEVLAPVWRILSWFMIQGVLYQDQWEALDAWMENYNLYKMNVDSTGVGDATGDYYIKKFNGMDYDATVKMESKGMRGLARGVKFSPQSKHVMYSNLDIAFKEGRVIIPGLVAAMTPEEHECFKRFRSESLSALREWKGSLLNVRHPDRDKGEGGDVETDDSLDSLALFFFDWELEPNSFNYIV